jgi:hypothetical protein
MIAQRTFFRTDAKLKKGGAYGAAVTGKAADAQPANRISSGLNQRSANTQTVLGRGPQPAPRVLRSMNNAAILREIKKLQKRKALLLRLEAMRNELSELEKAELCGSEAKNILRVIVEATCEEFRVNFGVLLSRARQDSVVVPRQVVFYIGQQKGISLSGIGRALRRDHGTVMYGVRSLKNRIDTDMAFAARLGRVMQKVDEKLRNVKLCREAGQKDDE